MLHIKLILDSITQIVLPLCSLILLILGHLTGMSALSMTISLSLDLVTLKCYKLPLARR